MAGPELTGGRWKELLEGVREELGGGRLRGVAWRRRLEFSSVAGNWELRVGDDGDGPTCICLDFAGKKRFPAGLRITPGSSPGSLRTGDERFDAAGSIATDAPKKWEGRVTAGVQGSVLRLWDLHPRATLTVHQDRITATLPGTRHDRGAILSFVFHGSACVGEVLHAASGIS